MMEHHNNLFSRAKIEDDKKTKQTETCETRVYTPTLSSLPPSILPSLSSSHHLVSCAPSMPQNHVGPDLLNLSPSSLTPNASNFPISSTHMCCIAKSGAIGRT